MTDPKTKEEPRPSDVPITGRKLAARLPAEWLDRILVALCEVEPGQPVDDALTGILAAAAEVLPHASFGVRLAGPPVLVMRRSPSLIAADPPLEGRLFPELACESRFDLEPGGVLSIAANDPQVLPDAAAVSALASRLSLALAAALRTAQGQPRRPSFVPPPGDGRLDAVNRDKLAGLGRIVAGVVHELSNPVTSILAYAGYLRRKAEHAPLEPADLERIARITEAAERVHAFSRDLLAYARPSTESPAPLEIHDVLDRALVFCEHLLARVTVDRAFGEVKPIRGISDQLVQVFVNLFTNAAVAMGEAGGTLRIQTLLSESGRTVHVTVIDSGRGIPEDALARIFEPFFTTTKAEGGTGLGLSIVRDIVEAHDGRVWAESRTASGSSSEPESGAVFHVALPAAAEPPRVLG
jgi:two-component system NtrC family sensor kinase